MKTNVAVVPSVQRRKRRSKTELFAAKANKLVKKADTQFGQLAALAALNPTDEQRTTLMDFLTGHMQKLQVAFGKNSLVKPLF